MVRTVSERGAGVQLDQEKWFVPACVQPHHGAVAPPAHGKHCRGLHGSLPEEIAKFRSGGQEEDSVGDANDPQGDHRMGRGWCCYPGRRRGSLWSLCPRPLRAPFAFPAPGPLADIRHQDYQESAGSVLPFVGYDPAPGRVVFRPMLHHVDLVMDRNRRPITPACRLDRLEFAYATDTGRGGIVALEVPAKERIEWPFWSGHGTWGAFLCGGVLFGASPTCPQSSVQAFPPAAGRDSLAGQRVHANKKRAPR